jgi:hypothetical protein
VEALIRFLALVALYAGMQCLALAMGGGLTQFADYESPKPEWRRAIFAGLISAVGVILLDAYVQTNLNTFKDIRRAERTLFYGSMLILLVCHRFVYRSGDEADMYASGAMLWMLCYLVSLVVPLNESLHPWVAQKRHALAEKMEIENRNRNDSPHENDEDP